MYRFLVLTTLAVVLALVVVLAVAAVQPEADVVLVNGAAVHDLDPAKMSWMQDIRTAYGLWEGLLSMNPRTLAPEPAVAERFTVSDDGRVYTFHIRPTARWSNGNPVTAEDFQFAWLRVIDPATASDYYTLMFLIQGAEGYYNHLADAYRAGRFEDRPDPAGVGIRVKSERELEVTLVRRTPYFPELVAFATFLPVHRQSMAPFWRQPADAPGYYESGWLAPDALVCNGPFTLERWEFQYRLLLRRNPQYWDRGNVPSERISLLANPDVNTAFLSYESGSADVLTNLPEMVGPELIRQSRAGRRNDLHIFPVWGTYYYRFNCQAGPLADRRVRRALAMCVDREAIVGLITKRGERPQTSFVTPGLFTTIAGDERPAEAAGPGWRMVEDRLEYVPAEGLRFDPAEARRLLAEAGYGPGGRRFVTSAGEPVAVLINDSTAHMAIAEYVTAQWQEHLGIEVRVQSLTSSIAGERMDAHQFEIARSGWFTDYGDPTGYLDMFRSNDGNNDGQFRVARYDELLASAAREADPVRRYELLHQAERLLVDSEAGVIPIYQYVGQFMFGRDIGGIYLNPKQQIMLKHVFKDGSQRR